MWKKICGEIVELEIISKLPIIHTFFFIEIPQKPLREICKTYNIF